MPEVPIHGRWRNGRLGLPRRETATGHYVRILAVYAGSAAEVNGATLLVNDRPWYSTTEPFFGNSDFD